MCVVQSAHTINFLRRSVHFRKAGRAKCFCGAAVPSIVHARKLAEDLDQTARVAGSFVPLGTYCLILGDAVRVVDSRKSPQLLRLGMQHLFRAAQTIGQSSETASMVPCHAAIYCRPPDLQPTD